MSQPIERARKILIAGLALAWFAGAPTPAARAEEGMAPVAGGSLHYEVQGAGEPVVFLHGGQLDLRMWDGEVERFAPGYRIVRYDARGYGRSPAATAPYSDADDLRDLLDHLGIRRAHLVGLSLGGRIALDFAVVHPERVASMVLAGPGLAGFDFPDPEGDARYLAAIDAAREEGPQAAVEAWLKDPYMLPAMEDPARAARIRRLALDNAAVWFANPLLGRRPKPLAAERLGEIHVPVLLLEGERDVPYIHAVVEALAKGVAGARRVVIPGAGHMVNLEKPAEFDREVAAFLAQHAGPPRAAAAPTSH